MSLQIRFLSVTFGIFIFLAILLFHTGCSSDQIKKVGDTYANGDPKHINYYRIEGNDSILTGVEYLYQNGNKQLEGSISDDSVMNGHWIIWFENGKKNAEAVFEHGIRKDNWKVWDFEGRLLSGDLYYLEEDQQGFPLIIRFFKMEGESKVNTGEVHFYPNHLKETEGPVKSDKKHGLWKAWYKDGTKWSEGNFQYDVNHGKHTVWHENGQKFYEGNYFVGSRTGIWTFWGEDGRVVKELNYDEIKNKETNPH